MTKSDAIPAGDVTLAATQNKVLSIPLAYIEEAVTIAIFGASGDLTRRKLIPGLYALYAQGLFHERLAIIGYARSSYDDETFRERMREAIKSFSRLPIEEPKLDEFIRCLYYHSGD
jgi:glucose-6-phosphate 1-dehydrogenase